MRNTRILWAAALGSLVIFGQASIRPQFQMYLPPSMTTDASLSQFFSAILAVFGIGGSRSNTNSTSTSTTATVVRAPKPSVTTGAKGTPIGSEEVPVGESVSLTLFSEACRSVTNARPDGFKLMVPTNTKAEWDSIQAHPPQDVTISDCICGKPLTMGDVNSAVAKALGFDPLAVAGPLNPMAGDVPPYSSNPATLARLCRVMGCGAPTLLSSASFSSPGNNTILRWNGVDWEKFPASEDNTKLNHKAPTLQCAVN